MACVAIWPVRADATAVFVSQSPLDGFLESGGSSCHDPYSWVWSAPRAERVLVSTPPDGLCEIGATGCSRRPESLFSAGEMFDSVKAVCGLKSKQYANSAQTGTFDNEACVQAESRVILESLVITIDNSELPRGPACSQEDPSCQSLPPLPTSVEPPVAPAGSGLTAKYELAGTTRQGHRPSEATDELADGVSRRVDRPPTPSIHF